jgi:hypothetical protein
MKFNARVTQTVLTRAAGREYNSRHFKALFNGGFILGGSVLTRAL